MTAGRAWFVAESAEAEPEALEGAQRRSRCSHEHRTPQPPRLPGSDRFGPMTPLLAVCRVDRLERVDCTTEEWPAIRAALRTFAVNARSLGRNAQAEFAEAEAKRMEGQ